MTDHKSSVALHRRPPARPGDVKAGVPWLSIHGWCCDHRAMLPVAGAFPERGHILVDLPGHGASAPAQSLDIDAMADRVLAAVSDTRFIAIGHSMGALVALALAVRAPERVAGLVLLEPAHIVPTPKARENAEVMRRSLARFAPADIVRAFARSQLHGPLAPRMAAAFDELVETMAATAPETARGAWDAVLAFDGAAALSRLAVPTLAIAIDKPVNRLADLARASPCITTGQVAAAGHMVQFEAMGQVAEMIARWLVVTGLGETI